MGTIKRGILGGFSGKVANVVGTSWKGIAVMKSLPLSVANPQTVAQVANRTRQTKILTNGQALGLTMLRKLWNRWAVMMSGFNSFMSVNKDSWTSGGTFYPLRFMLSVGSYTKLSATGLTVTSDASLKQVLIDWSNSDNYLDFSADDMVYAVAIDQTTGVVLCEIQEATFSDDTITLNTSTIVAGQHVHVYISVVKQNGSLVSDSLHIDSTVVA